MSTATAISQSTEARAGGMCDVHVSNPSRKKYPCEGGMSIERLPAAHGTVRQGTRKASLGSRTTSPKRACHLACTSVGWQLSQNIQQGPRQPHLRSHCTSCR
ncbi:unnamed protein product, partial [Ectocarpus sp. 6 AP-2014]